MTVCAASWTLSVNSFRCGLEVSITNDGHPSGAGTGCRQRRTRPVGGASPEPTDRIRTARRGHTSVCVANRGRETGQSGANRQAHDRERLAEDWVVRMSISATRNSTRMSARPAPRRQASRSESQILKGAVLVAALFGGAACQSTPAAHSGFLSTYDGLGEGPELSLSAAGLDRQERRRLSPAEGGAGRGVEGSGAPVRSVSPAQRRRQAADCRHRRYRAGAVRLHLGDRSGGAASGAVSAGVWPVRPGVERKVRDILESPVGRPRADARAKSEASPRRNAFMR